MIFLHKFNLKNLNIPSRISNKSRPFAMSLNRHVCPLSLALFYEHEGKFPCRIRDERKTAKKKNFNAKQEGIWRAKKREITSTFGYGTLEGSGRKKLTWIHFEVYVVELHQLDPRKLTHDPPSTAPNQRIDQRSMPFLTEFHFFTLNFEIFTRNLPKMFFKTFFCSLNFFSSLLNTPEILTDTFEVLVVLCRYFCVFFYFSGKNSSFFASLFQGF